ncbi:uncharacterized protein N0V89_001743 [Didymosphaeria variabile]|uniref:Rhodopsin domain-containing protein n=1 Tax=Didymosphaeria variabile TaxID=1932322 RepID=A0A9W8XSS5_9PLEO|nr:uncharacterized protein N0V89_001743 [Didymosphaeria variabile]KAJ4357168.1 hypothetical protein N0V89_001743 [Didymosphaeria variabile]
MAPQMPSLPPGTDVWKTPAAPQAPPGYIQDLEHPATNKNIGIVTLSIFIAIATIFVCMRLYVRFRVINHKPWWDDLVLVLALPPQIAYTGITIWMLENGMGGRHIWDTSLGIIMFKLPYWTTVVAALPQVITLLVKNALLLLYLRIFKPNRLVRYGIFLGLFLVTTMYTAWMFIFIFQTSFDNQVGQRLSYAQAAFNIATDVYIFVLPISGVARLHMTPKRKIGVIAIFSSGIAAIVMSCLNLYWKSQYNGVNPDPTWSATIRMTISVLEIDVGIICACMPLFATFLPKRARLVSWGTYIRSMRTRLIRTNNASQGSKATGADSHYGNVSDSSLVNKNATYVELNERKSNASSAKNDRRREWFDATTSLTQDTNIDRASKDVTQLAQQMAQQQQQKH